MLFLTTDDIESKLTALNIVSFVRTLLLLFFWVLLTSALSFKAMDDEILLPHCTLFKKILEDINPFCGATDTPVLDLWWYLLSVSNPTSKFCLKIWGYCLLSLTAQSRTPILDGSSSTKEKVLKHIKKTRFVIFQRPTRLTWQLTHQGQLMLSLKFMQITLIVDFVSNQRALASGLGLICSQSSIPRFLILSWPWFVCANKTSSAILFP